MDIDDIPVSRLEQVRMLEGILMARATTAKTDDGRAYEHLRREFMGDDQLRPLLPDYVRTCRTLDTFWPYISGQSGRWAERRSFINTSFNPLIEHLEGRHRSPSDHANRETLALFDTDSVHAVKTTALTRRRGDPEGVITVPRTLLETVCKRILDDESIAYSDKDDLPKLYGSAARALRLAPDQHREEPLKAILRARWD